MRHCTVPFDLLIGLVLLFATLGCMAVAAQRMGTASSFRASEVQRIHARIFPPSHMLALFHEIEFSKMKHFKENRVEEIFSQTTNVELCPSTSVA
mmetsp:Transcript_38192/g.98539  ORF Transcript_38192/g.98539 Transcript_38192/m.98539 type:complete len:95 (-) Transcript_38192:16-300(-)